MSESTHDQNEIIQFERMAHGPNAVGRLASGKVVMAPGVAPGDRVKIKILKEHKGYIEAEIAEVVERSADYREPACQHARSGECGGCGWQHLDESAQQREKERQIKREINRVAPEAELRPIRTDVPPFGYRRRAKLGHKPGMLGYRKRGVREIFDVQTCPVLVPKLEAALGEIRASVNDWKSGNVDVMVDRKGRVVVGGPARSFLQPSAMTEKVLVEMVLDAIPPTAHRIEELFAGSGTFTIPLLERGHHVRAFEGDKQTVALLQERAKGVVAIRADLLRPGVELSLGQPDVVLLDPPRKGAAPCMPAIIRSQAPMIVYVSCEATTLCRDIETLRKGGYQVDWVQPIDAFPQTEHVETVAVLRWKGN
ncbi:MAG: 23S rRNA (uracil1939-C5)-methyltransferase [Myxococcota bacterium]|jgi:23S rRNA (uracil1939-C5)-methyltransferase